MKMMLALAIVAVGLAGPAEAEVIERWDDGFVARHRLETSLGPDEAWAAVIRPAGWWNAEHTWSGDAANLTLEARPDGCWCETLPGGGARHGTVAMAWPGRRLVVDAALGPLMGMSSGGWLTVELEPRDVGGTVATVTYRVEGHALGALADPVDGVIGEQTRRLGAALAR